nr:hypothetical protein HK105_000590 [Polyrhizophydium stewartii]
MMAGDASTTSKYFRKALDDLTVNNLGQVRTLAEAATKGTATVVPDDAGLKEALAAHPFSRLAYFNDVCAGAVLCKKIAATSKTSVQITTVCVLPAYRRLGLATMLVKNVVDEATEDAKTDRITVTVESGNHILRGLLEKHGFTVVAEADGSVELAREC